MTATVLFGGSFNPFHNAHLSMIHAVLDKDPELNLQILPAGSPPHKQGQTQIPFHHRLAMLQKLALELGPRVQVNDLEAKLPKPSYTYNTIKAFKDLHPHAKPLYFLIGGDSLQDLPKWYRFQDLLEITRFLIVQRPGYDLSQSFQKLEQLLGKERTDQMRQGTLTSEPSKLSSTNIRSRLSSDQSVEQDLPPTILAYLEEHQLL